MVRESSFLVTTPNTHLSKHISDYEQTLYMYVSISICYEYKYVQNVVLEKSCNVCLEL